VSSPLPAPSGVTLVVVAPGAVELRNTTDKPVRMSWNMAIEREGSAPTAMPVWDEAHFSTMTMAPECFKGPPKDGCVTVPAHGAYKPLPWRGWIGCTQCLSCRGNVPAAPGSYRIVAFECDTGARHESAPLVVVEPGRFAGTPHVYAPKDEPNGIVIDNEGETAVSFRTHVAVDRLNQNNAFVDTGDRSMLLSSDCFPDAGADACVSVAPHASLRAMAYGGFKCARCAKCAAEHPVRPGTYMLTVSRCDAGEPYRLQFVVDPKGTVRPSGAP
jgi:hypothetical protein